MNRSWKGIALAVLMLATAPALVAAERCGCDPDVYHPVTISFFPPISTSRCHAPHVRTNFALNIVGGYAGTLEGIEIGTLFNVLACDATGLMLAGGYNRAGGDFAGLQLGMLNCVGGETRGVQLGAFNRSVGPQRLAQLGVGNLGHSCAAVQLGAFNAACGNTVFQLGAVDLCGKSAGFQLGGFNMTRGCVMTTQLGAVNGAGGHVPVQLGAANIAGGNTGLVLGGINVGGGNNYVALGGVNLYHGSSAFQLGAVNVAALDREVSHIGMLDKWHRVWAGFQLGGFNLAGGKVITAQVGGINLAGRKAPVQLGAVNGCGGKTFLTIGGINLGGGRNVIGLGGMNIVKGRSAFQLGGVNVAGGMKKHCNPYGLIRQYRQKYSGVQIGGFNIAGGSVGLQLGAVNVASTARWFQLGAFNFARESDIPVGPLNVILNGQFRVQAFGSEAGLGHVEFKTGGRTFYNILGVGYHPLDTARIMLGYGLGLHFPCGWENLFVDADIVGYRVNPMDDMMNLDGMSYLAKLRATAGWEIAPPFSVIGGLAVNGWISDTETGEEIPYLPIPMLTIEGDTNISIWPGVSLGFEVRAW